MPKLYRWVALLFSSLAVAAIAQSPWPNKPIKWIVPYPPGGITDSVTRVVLNKVSEAIGQPIIVENKPGANSIVGAELAAKSAPDGYTFVTVIGGHAANATLYAGRLSFDPVKSFSPVALAGISPLIITATQSFPGKDVKGLIDYAKANPGKLSFASSGVGSATHLTFELLKQTAGIDMVHVPFKGTAPAVAALIAGDVQIMGDTPSALMPQVRAGKIKALGLFASKRSAGATEVPTITEAGGPAVEGSTWVLFLAPVGTPQPIINRLSGEVAKVMHSPDMKQRFEQLGIEPVGSTPAEAGKFLENEVAKWAKVITTAGVKAE